MHPRLRQPSFVLPLLVFVFFCILYLFSGHKLMSTPGYKRDDVFFRADTKRAAIDLVGDRLQLHNHTSGHPNFVILHQPFGYLLRLAFKSVDKTQRKAVAAIVLTSLAGAGTAALLCALLLSLGLSKVRAALFACVLGFSTTHLFFASMPETYVFSALGLTAVAFLAQRSDFHSAWWQAAAVYACSILTTNVLLVGLWTIVRHRDQPTHAKWATRVIVSLSVTVGLMTALNLIQHLIYPTTVLFFMPSSVGKEASWLCWENLQAPLTHARILLQHLWLSNIVAPEPSITRPFGQPMASIEAGTWDRFAAAWPLYGLWLTMLAALLIGLGRQLLKQPLMLTALIVLAFNFSFFFVFGNDRMLYSCLWTSMTVLIVAFGWESVIRRWPTSDKMLTTLLALFVSCQAWHNWHFLTKIVTMVQSSG